MNSLPIFYRTPTAHRWLQTSKDDSDRVMRALLSTIDGHRNVVQLESFARAMGLDAQVLERMRSDGLIELRPDELVAG